MGISMVLSESLLLEAQRTLDDLRREGLIPFPLIAYTLKPIDQVNWYEIGFYDSRLHSIAVNWEQESDFSQQFRTAVLDAFRSRSKS